MYDSIKPVLLVGPLEGNFLASFLLGWTVTTGAGIASYPLDTIRRRMMMTSGEVSKMIRTFPYTKRLETLMIPFCRLSSIARLWMLDARLLPRKVSDLFSRVLVRTFFVVLLVLACYLSTTKPSSYFSGKLSRADLAKRHRHRID